MVFLKVFIRICPVIFISILLFSCEKEQETETVIIRPVRYEQVFSTGGQRDRTFSGVAKAGIETKLSFKVPGTIKNLRIKVGDTVKAGDLLAVLDDVDYTLQVSKAEAALTQAKAQLRNASAQYERIRLLYENDNASQNDLGTANTAFESAQASVSSFERTLELSELQLDYTKLFAPTDGAIAAVDVEENENINAGERIAMLSSGSRIEVEVSIPEKLISQIREGKKVSVAFDAVAGEVFSGLITEVSIASDSGTAAYPVTVKLDKSAEMLRAGMAAEVTFSFDAVSDRTVILVPSHSVLEDRDGRYVFVAEPSEENLATTVRKKVRVGDYTTDGIEVLEGLDDGDRVVTAGMSKIVEGMTVKLHDSKEN